MGTKLIVLLAAGLAISTAWAEEVPPVVTDEVPPTIASLVAAQTPALTASWITVVYSEPVTPETAGARTNYTLSGGARVSEVALLDESAVILTTTDLTLDSEYTLTVNHIQDQSAATNVIAANTRLTFTISLTPGALLWEFYPDIPGNSVAALTGGTNYPDHPSRREFLSSFTTGTNLNDAAETFGARVSGWITPKESGNYQFFIRSDDASVLLLSADDDLSGATPIAEEPDCCNPFLESGEGVTQTSAPTTLMAGRRYFIQALYKEDADDDFVEVAWRKEGDTTPAEELQPIAGEFLSSYRSAGPEPTAAEFNLPVRAGDEITITWIGTGTLQESTDLKTWTNVPGNPVSGVKVPSSSGHKFYRLR